MVIDLGVWLLFVRVVVVGLVFLVMFMMLFLLELLKNDEWVIINVSGRWFEIW